VAITATGSGVAGWQLWQQPGYQTLWAFMAGFVSVLAFVHGFLNASSRIKYWSDAKARAALLRHGFQTLRYRVNLEPAKAQEFNAEYLEYAARYADFEASVKNSDFFLSPWLRNHVQEELNKKSTGK
jgi:hypothetical protein